MNNYDDLYTREDSNPYHEMSEPMAWWEKLYAVFVCGLAVWAAWNLIERALLR